MALIFVASLRNNTLKIRQTHKNYFLFCSQHNYLNMKKSLFSILFLAMGALSFYQCQKDTGVQNIVETPASQLASDRKPCPITLKGDVDVNICGTDQSTAACTTCNGLNGTGAINVAAGSAATFYPSTIIFSVRNLVDIPGAVELSNANGAVTVTIPGNGCVNFTMSGCDIIPL
jgi:hypothetical protein